MKDKEKLLQDLIAYYSLDKKSAESVLEYAHSLVSKDRKANDFALAKALNERATAIFDMFASSDARSLDITAINKSYVLLVNTLKKIYARNDELSAIERKPVWEYFDIIEGLEDDIREYTNDWNNDAGQSHNARVNKLCIVAGKEKPDYTPELKQVVQDANKAISAFRKQLDEQQNSRKTDSRNWYIAEYQLAYSTDGTILVNGVWKLKKAQAGSASDRLMEQATKQPNTLFKPNLGQYSRNLSTTLSGIGFSGTLRKLFFPTVSEDKGIVFRPTVTRATADDDRIDTAELDIRLKQLGADITEKELTIDDIPF